MPTAARSWSTSAMRRRRMSTAATRRASSGRPASMASSAASTALVSRAASTTAAMSVSLSGKTRKIVPSAMPAASAIWRVVSAAPWARRSGSVASTMRALRSAGGADGGHGPERYMSEHSLSTSKRPDVAGFTRARRVRGPTLPPPRRVSEATMADRPLRQYYATDDRAPLPVVLDPAYSPLVAPWRTHRARFLGALRDLDPADWDGGTRCTEWSVRDVVAHLVTVDGFWPVTMATARDGGELTTFLAGFDPSTSPDTFAKSATADLSTPELLERHAAALDGLDAFVADLDDATWTRRCESPLGHMPASLLLAHGYWDSWLHECDVFVPRGDAPPVSDDDLVAATAFSLCFAARSEEHTSELQSLR